MNKRHGMIAVALVALLLMTGCSTFFTGGVTGVVKYNNNPIGGARVAVYFDEGQCNSDLASYKTNEEFHTKYTATTSSNPATLGEFAITNIPWDSAFPEYGKDADEVAIYILFYHEEYGIQKYRTSAYIISGRNNNIQLVFDEKIVDSDAQIKLSFQNPKSHEGTAQIESFRYKYIGNPTEGENKEFVSKVITVPATGNVTIPVPYYNYDGKVRPDITIFDMKSSEKIGTAPVYTAAAKNGNGGYDAKNEFVIEAVDDDHLVIDVIPQIIRFNGFSGRIYVNKYSDTHDIKVELQNEQGNKVAEVVAQQGKSDNIDSIYYSYEGLGKDEVLIENPDLDPNLNKKYKLFVYETVESGSPITNKRERDVNIKATPSATEYVQNFNMTIV